jgi:serine phosphatase RsbU (regulator of sigma subunit)
LEARNQELAKKIEEATQEINEQKKELEIINEEVYESIFYAKRIQEAILPSPHEYTDYLDISIIYKPRDIVSGDFYFFDKQGDNLFLVVADCTGHGVPGALMSMLGQNSLQSIITENSINEPAEILQLLDLRVQVLLHQQGGASNDGMDMVLVKFDLKTKWLEFAGANRPLSILKNNGEYIEMKPDRFPIGGDQYANKIFTPRNIQLENGDRFFMFTDGIVDQFGGPEGRKFTPKKLRTIIKENHRLSLEKQVEIIKKSFDEWKGNNQQTDDVLFIGFEIK